MAVTRQNESVANFIVMNMVQNAVAVGPVSIPRILMWRLDMPYSIHLNYLPRQLERGINQLLIVIKNSVETYILQRDIAPV
jgi:hypothetical protein